MATNEALAQGLAAVQRVIGSGAFIALAADNDALKECFDDPRAALRRRGIELPEEVKRVEMKVRHTPPAARQRGLRGGNFEWRFAVQVGDQTWRVIHLCDAWPLEASDAPDAVEQGGSV
jgi:hypothetical protein